MTGHELNEAIKADIDTIKALKMDIIPSAEFYKEVRSYTYTLYGILVMLSWLTMSMYLNDFYSIVGDLILVSLLMLVPGWIISTKVAEYVFFLHSIKPHISLGRLIDDQFKRFTAIFIGVYFVLQFIYVSLFHSLNLQPIGERGFGTIACFIVSIGITNWLVQMELTRVGTVSLFYLINSFSGRKRAQS